MSVSLCPICPLHFPNFSRNTIVIPQSRQKKSFLAEFHTLLQVNIQHSNQNIWTHLDLRSSPFDVFVILWPRSSRRLCTPSLCSKLLVRTAVFLLAPLPLYTSFFDWFFSRPLSTALLRRLLFVNSLQPAVPLTNTSRRVFELSFETFEGRAYSLQARRPIQSAICGQGGWQAERARPSSPPPPARQRACLAPAPSFLFSRLSTSQDGRPDHDHRLSIHLLHHRWILVAQTYRLPLRSWDLLLPHYKLVLQGVVGRVGPIVGIPFCIINVEFPVSSTNDLIFHAGIIHSNRFSERIRIKGEQWGDGPLSVSL